jgi:hypothetical protein
MRYKACTPADIKFLQSCISSKNSDRHSVNDNEFHNVSIITAFNNHKDSINALGMQRFATKTGQNLTVFYSEDKLSEKASNDDDKITNSRKKNTNRRISSISDGLQCWLWDAPHSTVSDFILGKLALCIDMPIMIRSNAATELCMTKGQEGTVYAWQSSLDSHGQQILDTLFVKLTNPPQNVTIDGLPENVVPLVPNSKSVTCQLPDNTFVCMYYKISGGGNPQLLDDGLCFSGSNLNSECH